MRNYLLALTLVLTLRLGLSTVAFAQTAESAAALKDQKSFSTQDLSGIWAVSTPRGVPWYNYALTGDEPPMTPWAEAKRETGFLHREARR